MKIQNGRIGQGLLGIGGALLAIGALQPLNLVTSVPPWAYKLVIAAGVGVIGIGLIYLLRSFENPFSGAISYESREAKRKELRTIWKFAQRMLPECPSWTATKRHYNKTPRGFHVVERIIETRWGTYTKVVGFLTIVPITVSGVKELMDGSEFQEGFIAPSFQSKDAQGIYAGSIAAHGARARGEALGYLRGSLQQLTQSGLGKVFTRPITEHGLRLAHHHNYSPVRPEVDEAELGHIYQRQY